MAQCVCIGHADKLDPSETIYFDYQKNQEVLPSQIRSGQNNRIDFDQIKKGSSCEGVASLFLNILKIGRTAITEIYDDATQAGILSFTVVVKNGDMGHRLMHGDRGSEDMGYQGSRLILNDRGHQVVAILPRPANQYATWHFIKRPDDFENPNTRPPMAIVDFFDHCDYIDPGKIPNGWPDGWGTALFDTQFNLSLNVVFKEGGAKNWRRTISAKHKIWKLVEKDLPSSSGGSRTNFQTWGSLPITLACYNPDTDREKLHRQRLQTFHAVTASGHREANERHAGESSVDRLQHPEDLLQRALYKRNYQEFSEAMLPRGEMVGEDALRERGTPPLAAAAPQTTAIQRDTRPLERSRSRSREIIPDDARCGFPGCARRNRAKR